MGIQYYDMAILVLPAVGTLLLAWASIPRSWNSKTWVALAGALMILVAFVMAYYKTYVSPREAYESGFWIFLGCYILLTAIYIYVIWRKQRKTVSKPDPRITTLDTVPSTLLVDEAITLKEQDRLNRNKFADQFAQTLMGHHGDSCLVAALHGPWGSGKSSLLNLIENQLSNSSPTNDYIVIRFNPWNVSNLDQLITMFFHELKVAIGGRQQFNADGRKIAKLLDIFSGILMVSTLSPVGGQYFAVGAEAVKRAGGVIKENRTKSLVEIKRQLDKEISKIAKRIFILVDDIDRLDKDTAKLLFRMIRLNADFRNTTYLLAFELDVVKELVKEDQPEHPGEYLEKIIQLPVHIPDIDDAVLDDLLVQELDVFVNKYNGDKFDENKTRWQELLEEGRFFKFFRTIRDIVRYSNGLNLNYALVSGEVNMVDFMALEGIRIFAPKSYDQIRRNKAILTGTTSTAGILKPKEDTELTKQILESIFDPRGTERGKIVETVCKVLFPQLRRIHGWVSSSSSEQKWRQQKRICSEEVFERYFLLGIPKGELSEEELKAILELGNDHLKFAEALNELFDSQLGKRFLERFEDYVGEVKEEDVLEIILGLFEIEERIVSEPRGRLQAGADYQAARLVYLLLMRIPEKTERKDTIIEAINKTSKIFSPIHFISLATPDSTEDTSRNEARVELQWSEEDSRQLRNLCVSKIRMAAGESKLSKSPHLGVLMYLWLHWGNCDEVKEYVRKLVETDEGVIDFVVGAMHEVWSSSTGYRLDIRQEDISAFIDIELIKTKVAGIKDSELQKLNEAQQEAVDAFLRSMSPNE